MPARPFAARHRRAPIIGRSAAETTSPNEAGRCWRRDQQLATGITHKAEAAPLLFPVPAAAFSSLINELDPPPPPPPAPLISPARCKLPPRVSCNPTPFRWGVRRWAQMLPLLAVAAAGAASKLPLELQDVACRCARPNGQVDNLVARFGAAAAAEARRGATGMSALIKLGLAAEPTALGLHMQTCNLYPAAATWLPLDAVDVEK